MLIQDYVSCWSSLGVRVSKVIHSTILLLTCIYCNSKGVVNAYFNMYNASLYKCNRPTEPLCPLSCMSLHLSHAVTMCLCRRLWCTEVKLWFGLRAGVARPGIVWAHEGSQCRGAPCQHALARAVIWSTPEWALCFCLCLGLSLISAPYLFSRSRVTCLRSWSPFFHTTNALWQQQPPPSKDFSSLKECLISQVCLQQILSVLCLFPYTIIHNYDIYFTLYS